MRREGRSRAIVARERCDDGARCEFATQQERSGDFAATVGAGVLATGEAKAVLGEEAIAGVGKRAEDGPCGPCEEPVAPDGGVGAAEDFHASDERAVGQNAVDGAHDGFEGGVVLGSVEGGVGDVDENEVAASLVETGHEVRLALAERAVAVDEDAEGQLAHDMDSSRAREWISVTRDAGARMRKGSPSRLPFGSGKPPSGARGRTQTRESFNHIWGDDASPRMCYSS